MTVNRQQFIVLLEPTLNDIKNDAGFPRRETIYTSLYDRIEQSKKATETDFERAGLGDFQVKNEGGPISASDPIPGTTVAYTHVRFGLRYNITQEMLDHDQFDEIIGLEKDLQISGDDQLEVQGHLLLNNGFGTTDNNGFRSTGFDSLALFSTAHTRLDGGATQANRPSTDASLSWTSLADGLTQFDIWLDNRGRVVRGTAQLLFVHPNDRLTAKELLGSELKPGTANNEINALIGEGLTFRVSPFITDTNSWFLKGPGTDARFFWDVMPRTASLADDEINEIVGRKRVQGYSHGHGQWFNWYGTSGTT